MIAHRDGTFSIYAHLQQGGRARVGQIVETGIQPPRSPSQPSARLPTGACQCSNGAVIHVDLPCSMLCGD